MLGAAGNVGKSYGLAGAQGQGQALLGRVAKLSGELQDALRPLAELDQALRRSRVGRHLDELGEALNPRLFEKGPSPLPPALEQPKVPAPDLEAAAKIRDPEVTLPEVEVSSPELPRPIDVGDPVDIAADLKASAQREAEIQIMRAAPTEIIPRVHRAGRGASLADEIGVPRSTAEATEVGDLGGSKGAFSEPTWPDGPGASGPGGAFFEPTATGPLWERPPSPAARRPAQQGAKPPPPAKETGVREATPTPREVQDNLHPASPEPEAAPTSPSEAPTEVPTFRIGDRKYWILATLGASSGAAGSA